MTPKTPPLVSIIVRGIGRPELATALASAAAQDHPALEILVVDATGGDHPPLPAIALRPGHSISMVSTGKRLPRPHAANAGLDALRGGYFCFLDDDDAYEPGHVSTLLAAASAHPECHVVYGQTQVRNPDGSVQRVFGQPFNRALMYFGPLRARLAVKLQYLVSVHSDWVRDTGGCDPSAPFQELGQMNTHRNARLTFARRQEMVQDIIE